MLLPVGEIKMYILILMSNYSQIQETAQTKQVMALYIFKQFVNNT